MRSEPKTFMVFGPGYWGIGESLSDAAKACHQSGCRKSEKVMGRLYYGAVERDIAVLRDGGVEYPKTAESVFLFGQVRLGELILK